MRSDVLRTPSITFLPTKTLLITIILILMTLPQIPLTASNTNEYDIQLTYTFEQPTIQQITIDGTTYDRITQENTEGTGNPGDPKLPQHGAQILLPPTTTIEKIDITAENKIYLGSNYHIEPVGTPTILSDKKPTTSSLTPNPLIYTSEKPYPQQQYEYIGTQNFRGYQIAILSLNPIQYIPKTGELYYYQQITIQIKTKQTTQNNPLFRNTEQDYTAVQTKIDNPTQLTTYHPTQTFPTNRNAYDLLILTTDEYSTTFESLKEKHDQDGILTEIKTITEIAILNQTLTPQDIRNFIRNEYLTNDITYLIIGGEHDIIPAQLLWVQAWSGGDTTTMPSDLYYQCLDGTYNYDQDSLWGEPTDGDNGGDVDLLAEIYIGRASVGSIQEATNFVDKTITFLESDGLDNCSVLMVGEFLWPDPDTFGGDYMDELIDGCNENLYTTVGIPSSQYTIEKLYDRDWPGSDWPPNQIIDYINNGIPIINHLGHSSDHYNMKMDNNDVNQLQNNDLCFIYSQGCSAGAFDDSDCIAEHFTIKTSHAAFAGIWNARYGWGIVGGTDGANQRFHRQFWDAVFGEEIQPLGMANQDSKEDNIHILYKSCIRWCYYELNLFGDPTLILFTDSNSPPETPDRPSGVEQGKVGEEYIFNTVTTDAESDELYYKWNFGNGNFSEWIGPFNSGEQANVTYKWPKRGTYEVRVKARDQHRAESPWSDPLAVKMPLNVELPFLQLFIDILVKYFPLISSLLHLT